MNRILYGVLIAVIAALAWKVYTDESRYEEDIKRLDESLNRSRVLVDSLRQRDIRHTEKINELTIIYNEQPTDEIIKKKYEIVISDIDNSDWNELDSILTAEGIIQTSSD